MDNNFKDSLKVENKPDIVSEFLSVALVLRDEGYDVKKIKQKTGGRNNPRFTLLEDLNLPESMYNKYPQLRKDYPIGRRINDMNYIIKQSTRIKATDSQRELLKEIFEGKKSAVQELIEVLNILGEEFEKNYMKIQDLQLRSKNEGVTLGQIYYEGYISQDTKDKLKSQGYEFDFPLGQRILGAKRLIDGKKTNYVASPKEIDVLKKYINPSRAYTK